MAQRYYFDLRFAIPPYLKFFVYPQPIFEGNKWNLDNPILKITLLIFLFVFFVVSIEIHITVTLFAESVRLRFGDFYFSGTLTVTLLASFLLPQPHFWYVYFTCVCVSPWLHSILGKLKRSLQTIPTFIIICTTQQEETITEAAGSAHQSGVELNEVGDHYHPSNHQPTWEPEGTYHRSGIELNEVDDYYLLNEQPTSEHEYLEVIYGHA